METARSQHDSGTSTTRLAFSEESQSYQVNDSQTARGGHLNGCGQDASFDQMRGGFVAGSGGGRLGGTFDEEEEDDENLFQELLVCFITVL